MKDAINSHNRQEMANRNDTVELSREEIISELKWKKFDVLDDGHVCLVDVMGDDYSIVEAARVSYGKGTSKKSDDETLIRYLLRHRHTTPFEMAEIKIRVRVPMDCWRQWIRHRSANVNEYSTRYSEAIDEKQKTLPTDWRSQSDSNKQGSGGYITEWIDNDRAREIKSSLDKDMHVGQYLSDQEKELHGTIASIYSDRLALGVAKEQARKDLPLSNYTEAYWKIDLHNLMHFLSLRMDSHAQQEIRDYATTIGYEIVKPLFPKVWKAFEDYRLNAMYLTSIDIEMIQNISKTNMVDTVNRTKIGAAEFTKIFWPVPERCRERDECIMKLRKLGLIEE